MQKIKKKLLNPFTACALNASLCSRKKNQPHNLLICSDSLSKVCELRMEMSVKPSVSAMIEWNALPTKVCWALLALGDFSTLSWKPHTRG